MAFPIPLPELLQPLLLIPIYQSRIAQSLKGWVEGSSDRLFGPLEQAVAAVVIIGIAINTPPDLWNAVPSVPYAHSDIVNTSSPNIILGHAPPPPSHHTGNALDHLRHLIEPYVPSTATLALIGMILNLLIMLIPQDVKSRLKASWHVFWPPWQNRSSTPVFEHVTESERAQASKSSERSTASENVTVNRTSNEDDKTSKKRRELTSEEKEYLKAKQKAKVSNDQDNSEKPTTEQNEMGPEEKEILRARQKEKLKVEMLKKKQEVAKTNQGQDKASDGSGLSGEGRARSGSSSEGLSQSERARRAKTDDRGPRSGETVKDRGDMLVTSSSSRDKGKQRMEGESPNSATATKTKSDDETTELSDKNDDAQSEPSGASSGDETDDPLMAGDYRPLRSVLKKSKKKPLQTKNVHHNYFMTMRGHQPHLIPFPHGFHPKPHYPRHSLWWNNVPKNVDHIMAAPPVPKKPEETDEGEGENGKEKEKEEKKVTTEEKTKSEADGKSGSMSSAEKKTTTTVTTDGGKDEKDKKSDTDKKSEEADKGKDKDKDKDATKSKEKSDKEVSSKSGVDAEKEKARAKLKAEAEFRERAKAKAAAAAKAKQTNETSGVRQTVSVNPQVQKATYVAQGMLCCLLYMVHEQLGLLLLAFFAYQHIQTGSSKPSQPPSTFSTSTSTSTRAHETHPPPQASPTARGNEPDIPAEMKDKLRQAKADDEAKVSVPEKTASSRPSEKGAKVEDADDDDDDDDDKNGAIRPNTVTTDQSTARDNAGGKPVESVTKLKTLADLTPEQRERYKRAKVLKQARQVDQSRLAATTKISPSFSPSEASEPSTSADDAANTKTPRTIDELSPDQRRRYEAALAEKKRKAALGTPTTSSRQHAGGGSRSGRVGESGSESKLRRLVDMTEAEREKYLRARVARTEKERRAAKVDQTSGLSAEEKEGLSSPT